MRALAAAIAMLPGLASGQARIQAMEEDDGVVVGRVCEDSDGDGRCSADEPGIPGVLVILEGGQVAETDAQGRYHFLAVPTRMLLPGRAAYGGHVVAVEGGPGRPRVSRYFELAPGGTALMDLAVPPGPRVAGPVLLPAAGSGPAAPRREGGRLAWILSGRAPAGSRVEVDGRPARAEADGLWRAEVSLAPHQNGFPIVVVEPSGRLSLHHQQVHLVPRSEGGDLVVPRPPELLAAVELPPPGEAATGRDLVIRGRAAPGVVLRIGESEVRPGPSGEFQVRVPAEPGERPLPIEARRGAVRVTVAPVVRFVRLGGAVAGLGDLELSLGSRLLLTGRGAFAARGAWNGIEGEAGVDLDDRDRGLAQLLHPRDTGMLEHQLEPELSFPTAGDGAAADDPNAARGRIYARLSAPGASLLAGALRPGITGHELGRYDRALYGLKISGEGDAGPLRLEGMAYGASQRSDPGQAGPPRPAHDELPATGGSLYYLARQEVVVGSEALRVEWRDPLTGLVADQKTLVRGVDYEIDYPGGRVLLARPLASVGGRPVVVTGTPILAPVATLFADYSYVSAGGHDDAWGGRGSASAGPVRLDAAVASEDRTWGAYRLGTGAAVVDLGAPFKLRAEVARSQGSAFAGDTPGFSRSIDGGFVYAAPPAPGPDEAVTAYHLEADGEAGGARYAAWWRVRPRGYSDSSHLEAVDARERGASAAWGGGDLQLSALYAERQGADPRDPSGLSPLDAREARGRAAYRLGDFTLSAEALDNRIDAIGAVGEQWSAGLRADWRVAPWLSLNASHHQSLGRDGSGPAAVDATFSAVGAEISGKDGTLSARGGWGPGLGPQFLLGGEQRAPGAVTYGTFSVDPDAPAVVRESVSSVGARQHEGSADVFSEEQFGYDLFGMRMSRVAGAALEPARWLRLEVSGESGQRIRLDGTEVPRTAAGAAATVHAGPVLVALRGELRQEGGDRQAVAGVAAEWQASSRLTFSGRGEWTNGWFDGRHALLGDGVLGAAWRGDGFSMLGKLAAIADQAPGVPRRDTDLASLAAAADIGPRLTVGLGLNVGLTRLEGARQDLASGSARVSWRIAGPFDAALEYARRQSLGGQNPDQLDAGRIEAGWSIPQGRLAAGYNFFGFTGTGVDPADQDRGRLYLRAEMVY